MTKWRAVAVTCLAVVLGSASPALGTTFSASLKDIVGQVPKARVEIKLVGCTGSITSISGSTVAPFYVSRFADGAGSISLTVPDQTSYSCANGGGPIYYHVAIYYTDSRGLEQKGPEGDFDITGSTFVLNSATPRSGVMEWLLANLRGIPLDVSVGTPTNGQSLIYDSATGKYKAGLPSAVADWDTLANKPATFPPSTHSHAESDVTSLVSDLAAKAALASPSLTGAPTAPTAAVDTNTTQLASTAFVLAQAASATPLINGSAATGTSTRYARADHVHPTDTSRAPLASPALTGTPTAPTATALDNSTKIATTAYSDAAVGVEVSARIAADAAKAPLASPTLTGNPLAPTPSVDDNDTSIATTAYVIGQASASGDGNPAMNGSAARGTAIHFARADHVHPTDTSRAASTHTHAESDVTSLVSDLAAKAALASPALTGTPTVPTAAVDTSTTQAASTAFVLGQASASGDGTPAALGSAARGTSTHFARADHVHPAPATFSDLLASIALGSEGQVLMVSSGAPGWNPNVAVSVVGDPSETDSSIEISENADMFLSCATCLKIAVNDGIMVMSIHGGAYVPVTNPSLRTETGDPVTHIYTIVASDNNATILLASPATGFALPVIDGTFPNGWNVTIKNDYTSTDLNYTASSPSTFDGGTSGILPAQWGVKIEVSDAGVFRAAAYSPPRSICAYCVMGEFTGSAGRPKYSTLVAGNIPSLDTAKITTGTWAAARFGAGVITDDKLASQNKPDCTLASTSNLTLSGNQTIDGVTGTNNQTVVCAFGQTTGSQNGPYVMQSGSWTRTTWWPAGGTTQAVPFSKIDVKLGGSFGRSSWRMTTPTTTATIDTTSVAFTETKLVFNANSVSAKVDDLDASNFCADAGANDTYTCSLSPAPTAYVTGTHYRFSGNTANTGAATINLNSLGAKTIKKATGGITTDLADNDIRAGQWVDLVYDGTNMQMQSTSGNAASAGDASTNTASSVDSEVALFSGTAGKTLKRATGTGIARLASGVQSAAELSGDATTSGSNAVTVVKVQGIAIDATPPTTGQTLVATSTSGAHWATPAGSGTVTASGGSLTANSLVLGAGTTDTKVLSGFTTDGTSGLLVGTNGGTLGSVTFKGTTAEEFKLTGRIGVGIPVAYLTPIANNSVQVLDMFPRGSPTDFSSNAGAVWTDWCSTDIIADGTNWECLRTTKWTTGNHSSAAEISTVKGGTGVVRNLCLQCNGSSVGKVGINNYGSASYIFAINDATNPAMEVQVAGTAKLLVGSASATNGLFTGSASGDVVFRGLGGAVLLGSSATSASASLKIASGNPGIVTIVGAGAFGSAGSHINTQAASTDIAGTIAISSSTSAAFTFNTAYTNAPNCTLTPTSDPTSTGTWWVTTSTTAVTAHVSISGTITFMYHCVAATN